MTPNVFIGSSTESLRLARRIGRSLEPTANVTVWDPGIFKLSSSTLGSLIAGLPRFDFGIFLLTLSDLATIRRKNYVVPRDNVIFELGLFFGHLGHERTFMLVPSGQKKLHIPTDLLGIKYARYTPGATVKEACEEFRTSIAATGVDPNRHFLGTYPDTVSSLLMSQTIARSPFVYQNLLRRAKREVFIAAQNHHHIAVADATASKKRLFSFLRAGRGRKARILACDSLDTPANRASIEAWSFVTSPMYKQHLKDALTTLSGWAREAKSLGLDLEVRAVPLVPVSVTFIDPGDAENAELVFTPNFYQSVAGIRACYYLSYKHHKKVFDDYWQSYDHVFNDARRLA